MNNAIIKLRAIATLMVVMIHCLAPYLKGGCPYGSIGYWLSSIFEGISSVSVPIFVMISGYLLLDSNKNQEAPGTFIRKRINVLLYPLIFWSIIYIIINFNFMRWYMGKSLNDTAAEIIKGIYSGSPYYHLWFIGMIAGLYLITPLLRKILKNFSNKEVLYVGLACLALAILANLEYSFKLSTPHLSFLFRFLPYIGYYLIGHALQYVNISRKRISFVYVISLLIMVIFNYLIGGKNNESTYFYEFLSLTVAISSISFFYIFIKSSCDAEKNGLLHGITLSISRNSFGIYLVHPLFALSLLTAKKLFIPSFKIFYQGWWPIITLTTEFLLVVTLAWLLCVIMKRLKLLRRFV